MHYTFSLKKNNEHDSVSAIQFFVWGAYMFSAIAKLRMQSKLIIALLLEILQVYCIVMSNNE